MRAKIDKTDIEIGKKLKEFREANKLTMRDAAKLLDVTYQMICKYEKGQSRVTLHTFIKICKVYNVDIEHFDLKELLQ